MKAINVIKEKDNSNNSNSNNTNNCNNNNKNNNNNDDDDDNDNDDNLNNELSIMSIDTSRNGSSHHRNCLYCLEAVQGSMRCSKCRTALYCDRDCQLKHWPVHKNSCQDSNTENSNEKVFMKATNHYDQGK